MRLSLKPLVPMVVAGVFLVIAVPSQAHAPWKHKRELVAPLIHHVKYLQKTVNTIRIKKCKPAFHTYAASRIPEERRASVRQTWLRRLKAALRAQPRCTPDRLIDRVFGVHASAARWVSWMESGWNCNAGNGQYRGLFQMGSSERERFGHGGCLAQVKAAYRYFKLSRWGPWECKPFVMCYAGARRPPR